MRALEDLNTVGRTCTRQLYEPMFIVSKGDCSKLKDAKFPDKAYALQRAKEESGDDPDIFIFRQREKYSIPDYFFWGTKQTKIFVKLCDSL